MHHLGIVVVKRKHAVAFLDAGGQLRRAVYPAENTRSGLKQLVEELFGLKGEASVGLVASELRPGERLL
jgi:hypothetical protein